MLRQEDSNLTRRMVVTRLLTVGLVYLLSGCAHEFKYKSSPYVEGRPNAVHLAAQTACPDFSKISIVGRSNIVAANRSSAATAVELHEGKAALVIIDAGQRTAQCWPLPDAATRLAVIDQDRLLLSRRFGAQGIFDRRTGRIDWFLSPNQLSRSFRTPSSSKFAAMLSDQIYVIENPSSQIEVRHNASGMWSVVTPNPKADCSIELASLDYRTSEHLPAMARIASIGSCRGKRTVLLTADFLNWTPLLEISEAPKNVELMLGEDESLLVRWRTDVDAGWSGIWANREGRKSVSGTGLGEVYHVSPGQLRAWKTSRGERQIYQLDRLGTEWVTVGLPMAGECRNSAIVEVSSTWLVATCAVRDDKQEFQRHAYFVVSRDGGMSWTRF